MQVIDGKFSEGLFTTDQLKDLSHSDVIRTCSKCNKRRILHPLQETPDEDKAWFCKMNQDKNYNSCKIEEQPELRKRGKDPKYINNNAILQHVVDIVNHKTRHSEIVHDYVPVEITHENDICCEEAIRRFEGVTHPKPKNQRRAIEPTEDETTVQGTAQLGMATQPIVLDSSESESEENNGKRLKSAPF